MSANNTSVHDIYSEEEELIEVEKVMDGAEGVLKISSIDDAARFAYGLSETRKSITELEEVAQKEIEKWQSKIEEVNAWLAEVVNPLKGKEEYLATQLQLFHINQFNSATDDKARKKLTSIKLPYSVTLKSRSQADQLKVSDEEAYLAFAKENNLIKDVAPVVDWAAMKKNIVVKEEGTAIHKGTGELLPFIKVVPQDRKFEVK